nr:hypothetical protein [Tanacetum cinerariifolium]
TNRVTPASAPVTSGELNSTNNTNSFNAAGPFYSVVSLNFEIGRKSSFVDPSQYPNDLNMLALEDITYSDDEEVVGANADFSNLKTSITISPIPTTRVHKDHPTSILACSHAFFLKKNPRESTKHKKILARIKAIRLFLAYASFMGFKVYQMDVKSAFLNETIKEKVYVCQPLGFEDLDYPDKVYKVVKTLYGLHQSPRAWIGFEDPDYPDKVYKVVKALYGLHQDPRAWYETLANYLLENGFQRGKIDHTLFIKKQKGDILLVQVFVDDITFGSTNKELLKQKDDGIFIGQHKYIAKILRKFGFTDVKSSSTPIETEKPLLKDPDGEDVDVHIYRLISWQCKKQTVVANSSTKAEYVAAAICYAQVLWIQNQLLDYGRIHLNKGEIVELDANKDITLETIDAKDADVQGRLDLEHAEKVLSMQDIDEAKPAKVEEVIKVVNAAKLMTDVVTTVATTITATQVPKASALIRKKGVVIHDPV